MTTRHDFQRSSAATSTTLRKPIRGHLPELDALRGVAALIVVLDHYRRIWVETKHPHWLMAVPGKAPVWFFFNGGGSVMLFFLLSGFVLALPAIANRAQPYAVYAVRRICKIYLPYLAALSLAVLGCWAFNGYNGYGASFQESWRSRPDFPSVVQHVLFLGIFDVSRHNPPSWSLVQEMRISLIFPIICWCALRLSTPIALALSTLLPTVASLLLIWGPLSFRGNSPAEFHIAFVNTLGYCGTFLLGALIAKHQDVIRNRFDSMSIVLHVPLFLIAMRVYLRPPAIPYNLLLYVQGFGAAYLLVAALSARGYFTRLLRTVPLQFAGRISYSLY